MNLKVYYRSPVIWNIILFIFFSFLFIYAQFVYKNTSTILDKELFKTFINTNLGYISIYIITLMSFLKFNAKLSSILFLISVLMTFGISTYNVFGQFSKLALVILFFYVLIAYYLYQFFNVDVEESYYQPQFDNNFLFEPMLTKIKIEVLKDGDVKAAGHLTNWSEEGCFTYLKKKKSLKGTYDIRVYFHGREFCQKAIIVSATKIRTGYGFKFKHNKKEEKKDFLGWTQFYEIIKEMGLKPELVK